MGLVNDLSGFGDAQSKQYAEKLAHALKYRNLLARNSRVGDWAQEFTTLKIAVGSGRVERVLDWYCENVGGEYIPEAYSGKSFREKFERIEAAMTRKGVKAALPEIRSLEILSLVEGLRNNHTFPPEINTNLGEITQRTQSRWDVFASMLHDQTKNSTARRIVRFCQAVLIRRNATFVVDWMNLIGNKFGRVEHYNANPMNLAFRPNHTMFRESFWGQWSLEWTGDMKTFDELLHELSEEFRCT